MQETKTGLQNHPRPAPSCKAQMGLIRPAVFKQPTKLTLASQLQNLGLDLQDAQSFGHVYQESRCVPRQRLQLSF